MANSLKSGSLFPEEIVKEMISKVKGHSSIAKLANQKPIPFNGEKVFVFNMEGEAEIVAEGAAKHGNETTAAPVIVRPVKFVYQSRVSDEFIHAAESVQLDYLQRFAEGFARKIGRGLDLAAFHGVNPRDNTSLASLATNNFDDIVTNLVTYNSSTPDDNLDAAIALINAGDFDLTGIVMSPAFGAAMSKVKVNGVVQYPEFRFGGKPNTFAGYGADINNTVSKFKTVEAGSEETVYTDHAIAGDFENFVRWGYAKNIPLEIIEYGDPDGAGRDLKQYNEVCLRSESYIGWGILDADAFAIVHAENT